MMERRADIEAHMPIVKRAARMYFRDGDECAVAFIRSPRNRRALEAIHTAFEKIESERERAFIETVYTEPLPNFADAVWRASSECRIPLNTAWDLIRTFIGDAAAYLADGG